jgi:hypothetical protein
MRQRVDETAATHQTAYYGARSPPEAAADTNRKPHHPSLHQTNKQHQPAIRIKPHQTVWVES